MLIICPNCFAKFEVNDRLLKKNVQKFVCSNCGERFEENLEALRADEIEPFNVGTVAAASAEVMMQEQEPSRELLGSAVGENAVRPTENTGIKYNVPTQAEQGQNGPSFNWTNQMEDLSVQSLPEEFTPVRETKKSKGLWFVFIFLLVIAGILAYAWYKRDDLLQQFPNVQKGIHLIMGKPYASLPSASETPATDAISADAQGADVIQSSDTIVEVQESDVQEPGNPTQDIMNESAYRRPSDGQKPADVENQAAQNVQAGTMPGTAPRMGIPANTDADAGHVRPLSMQGGNTDSADDVTLQEIDLNLLPSETENVPNTVSDAIPNVSRTDTADFEGHNNAVREMPVVIEEIQIDETGENLNGGVQHITSETVQSGVVASVPAGMSGNQNMADDNVVDTPVMSVSHGTAVRDLSDTAIQKPIVLDETVGVVIEEAPVAVQGTVPSEQGGVQVKDVVFRYDTSLSSHPRLYVQGIVSNMSADTITMPALTVEMFDKDNQLIGTQTVPPSSSELGSNAAEFFFHEIDPLPTGLVRRVNITAKN